MLVTTCSFGTPPVRAAQENDAGHPMDAGRGHALEYLLRYQPTSTVISTASARCTPPSTGRPSSQRPPLVWRARRSVHSRKSLVSSRSRCCPGAESRQRLVHHGGDGGGERGEAGNQGIAGLPAAAMDPVQTGRPSDGGVAAARSRSKTDTSNPPRGVGRQMLSQISKPDES